jgi:hypothetical protein
MNTTPQTPVVPRIVAPAFLAVAFGTFIGACALAHTFYESTLGGDRPDPGTEVRLDRSPFPGFFSDSEYAALTPAPAPAVAHRPLAPAPAFRPIERPVAVEVLNELAAIEPLSAPEPAAREASRAAAVWADGASRARGLGRYDLAVTMLRRAVDRAPDRHEYWVALAEAQADSGDSAEAATTWRRAAELSSRSRASR